MVPAKIKVCHYSPVAPPQLGGIETFLTTITRQMPRQNFLILTGAVEGSPSRSVIGNCDIVRYPSLLGRLDWSLPAARRAMHLYEEVRRRAWLARRARSFDVVHVHSLSAIRHYRRITSRRPWTFFRKIVRWYTSFSDIDAPILYTDHSQFIGSYGRFLRACGDVIIDNMAHVVCVDESGYRNATQYVRERGLARDIWFLPNAVDTDLFSYDPFEDHAFCVGYAGRIEKEGLDLFARVVLDAPELQFKACLAGDASRLPPVLARAPNLDLVWNVPPDRMPTFYRSVSVLLDPFSPGIPRTTVEALACGRPVVRIREEAERESALVPPEVSPYHARDEIDGVIQTLCRLRDDATTYRRLAEKSRRTAETTFSASSVARQYHDIYEKLSGNQGGE